MVTKKLKDITLDEAISICSKMAFCNGQDHNCQLYADSLGVCIFRNIHMMQTGDRGEYYNEHKNDLVTFEYDDGNTNTNGGEGISW